MSLPLVRLSPSGLVSLLLFVAYLAAIINTEIQHYSFVIEPTTVTRLCKKSTYVTVNGHLPGPTILVHDGDTVIVKTYNRAKYNATLHWHGVKQLHTGWADGPAYVTQCPIQPGGNFTQKFTITGQEGTLWWHAHFSWLQSTVHGAIVILPKRGSLYPFPKPFAEIPIIIGEWWSSDHLISLINQAVLTGGAPNLSDAFTINGQPGDLYHCRSESDIVNSLPRQPAVAFKQYAGYVTVDGKSGQALFYYFVEAETDPDLKPLVLWLNGGPGCSSLGYGALMEHGPFHPKGGKLIRNHYSWNREANVLYLESPAGVGFSYSNDSSFYIDVNDTKTAEDNLIFLHGWYNKFPEYKTRDLYLTGESYAGHYIPQLAKLIVMANIGKKIFNLIGIAIGNPLLDFFTDFNARAEFLWSHGLISDSTYNIMKNVCNYGHYVDEFYRGNVSYTCMAVNTIASKEVSQYINPYDVTFTTTRRAILRQYFKTKISYCL